MFKRLFFLLLQQRANNKIYVKGKKKRIKFNRADVNIWGFTCKHLHYKFKITTYDKTVRIINIASKKKKKKK